MKILIILLVAVAAAAAIVLFGTPLGAGWRPRRRKTVRFGDSFQMTGPGPRQGPSNQGGSFAYQPPAMPDERPPRPWSLVKIVAAIAVVGAAIAAGIYYLGYFVNSQLERLLKN